MFTRRRALKTIVVAGAVSVIGAPQPARAAFRPNLNDAFDALGFDPTAPGNTFIVLLADLHIDPTGRVYPPTIDDRIVNAITAMNPAPSRIVFLGDLAISCTGYFGKPFEETDRTRSLAELAKGKQELERFAPIPVSVMLGNHDTYNYDDNGSVWRQVFTTEPTYQSLQIGGMTWFLLNGNHSGYIDAAQEEWLAQEVAALDPAAEVTICVHQPALFSVGIERGIGQTMARIFARHTGRLWMFAGHAHRFSFERFSLPHTTITLLGVTTANGQAFGDGRKPGLMVACLSNGHLAGIVWRDCKQVGYEVYDHRQPRFPTVPLPRTWSSVPFPIRLFEEGGYDRSGILVAVTAGDTRTWWSYVGALTLRLPMHPRADQFLLLASIVEPFPIIEFSPDNGTTWLPATGLVASQADQLYTMPLPEIVRNAVALLVRVRVIGDRFVAGLGVAGFGLAARALNVTMLERWRLQHFGTILDEGAAGLVANPAGDGLNNLAKFAFGLNPREYDRRKLNPHAAGLGGEPILKVQKNAAGSIGLQATFLRRPADTFPGIQYQIEYSADLQHWRKVTDNAEIVTEILTEWELVETWIPKTLAGRAQYWRMNVLLE